MRTPELIEPDIVTIPEGDFLMGSDNGAANERPILTVYGWTFSASPDTL